MKTVIMAGGRGTRMTTIARDIPKPMVQINKLPVLEWEIRCLKEQGFIDFILTVGHLKDSIINYFGDGSGLSPRTGEPFGVKIEYFLESEPLGNAGALFKLKEKLNEDFFLLNGDLFFDVDFNRFKKFHQDCGGIATLFTHPNSHPYDSSIIVTDEIGAVLQWIAREDLHPTYYKNQVNAGLHILSPKILETGFDTVQVDLDRQILKPLAGTGKMFAYSSSEYVKDMGTPERYESVCEDLLLGKIQMKNLRNKQRAIFLDRDGTINRYVGFLKDIDEFVLLPGVAQAIKKINASGYLAIVVTNQPIIARGELTFTQLRKIHNKLETLLGLEGAYLDEIYFCPHHPDKGFPGEVPELKYECKCRKPKPGMLLIAAQKFNIDLSQSWMIGDRKEDIEAGKAAGCKTALLSCASNAEYGQTITEASLVGLVEKILEGV